MPRPVGLIHDDLFRRLVMSRDFIADAYDQPLRLESMAKKAGVSPFHFQRRFSAAFEQTPHQFLTKLRLERAKTKLLSDHQSVTEICFDVGFSSLGSFSALFTKHVGCSPREYRRRMKAIHQVPQAFERMLIPGCFLFFFGSRG